jgi:hypothetical protein
MYWNFFAIVRRHKESVRIMINLSSIYSSRDPSRWPRGTLYSQKLAITSPTSGGRSVGIVCSRTQAMEFSFLVLVFIPRSHWVRGLCPSSGILYN